MAEEKINIVENLRLVAKAVEAGEANPDVCAEAIREAADEIERFRSLVKEWAESSRTAAGSLAGKAAVGPSFAEVAKDLRHEAPGVMDDA